MYNCKLFSTAPKHYNARQLITHLIFTAIISSMVITADPSYQPPLSSRTIACYRGAVDGGRDGMTGMESGGKNSVNDRFIGQNSFCKEVMHDTCNQTMTELH